MVDPQAQAFRAEGGRQPNEAGSFTIETDETEMTKTWQEEAGTTAKRIEHDDIPEDIPIDHLRINVEPEAEPPVLPCLELSSPFAGSSTDHFIHAATSAPTDRDEARQKTNAND